MRSALAAIALVAVCATFVEAGSPDQTAPPQKPTPQKPAPPKPAPKPREPKLPLGLHAFFVIENESMHASSTFKAVTGSSSFFGLGGGGEVLNVWRKAFARFGFTSASKDGTRPIIVDGTVLDTGNPTRLGLRTIELSGGWRRYLKKHPRFAWYGGGGILFTRFVQTGDFAAGEEIRPDVFTGYSLFGGVDALIRNRVVAGVEAQFRSASDAIGAAGTVSGAYNETSLGGFAIRGLIGIRLRK